MTAKAYSCSYGKDPTEKQKSLNSGERIVLEAVQQSEGQRELAPRGQQWGQPWGHRCLRKAGRVYECRAGRSQAFWRQDAVKKKESDTETNLVIS